MRSKYKNLCILTLFIQVPRRLNSVNAVHFYIKENYIKACNLMTLPTLEQKEEAARLFEEIHSYIPTYEDSVRLEEECRASIAEYREVYDRYQSAVDLMHPNATAEELSKAETTLLFLMDAVVTFPDLNARLKLCRMRIEELEELRIKLKQQEQFKKQFAMSPQTR